MQIIDKVLEELEEKGRVTIQGEIKGLAIVKDCFDESDNIRNIIIEEHCPSEFGYNDKEEACYFGDSNDCSDCNKCWSREEPQKKEVDWENKKANKCGKCCVVTCDMGIRECASHCLNKKGIDCDICVYHK